MRFVIRSRRFPKRRWWWTLLAENAEPLCHSEQFNSKRDCRASIDLVVNGAYDAVVVDRSSI